LAPGPVWTDVENFAPTGIRSLDRPLCTVLQFIHSKRNVAMALLDCELLDDYTI